MGTNSPVYAAGPGVTSGENNVAGLILAGLAFLIVMLVGRAITGGRAMGAVSIVAGVLACGVFFAVAILPDLQARGV